MPSSALQIATFIIGTAAIIFAAYFVTYLVARGSQKTYRGRSIQVLDRFTLTKDKSILLVSVYDKIYVVAFSANAITVLDSLDPEAAAAFSAVSGLADPPSLPIPAWARKLSPLLGKLTGKNSAKQAPAPQTTLPFEEHLYARMKDRQGKEDQLSAFLDTAYFEEDTLK